MSVQGDCVSRLGHIELSADGFGELILDLSVARNSRTLACGLVLEDGVIGALAVKYGAIPLEVTDQLVSFHPINVGAGSSTATVSQIASAGARSCASSR